MTAYTAPTFAECVATLSAEQDRLMAGMDKATRQKDHAEYGVLYAQWLELGRAFDALWQHKETARKAQCIAAVGRAPVDQAADSMKELAHMDEGRLRLVREAAWEIDALARALPGLVPNTDETEGAHFVVRALAGRLLRLSHVLMGAADPAGETTEELAQVFTLNGGQG